MASAFFDLTSCGWAWQRQRTPGTTFWVPNLGPKMGDSFFGSHCSNCDDLLALHDAPSPPPSAPPPHAISDHIRSSHHQSIISSYRVRSSCHHVIAHHIMSLYHCCYHHDYRYKYHYHYYYHPLPLPPPLPLHLSLAPPPPPILP